MMKKPIEAAILIVVLVAGHGAVGGNDLDPVSLRSLIDNGEAKAVVTRMESRLKSQPASADVHYWLAEGQLAQIEEASTFRKLSLARAAKRHLLAALELEPAHVPALSSLGQFYLNAPAVAGGSKKQAKAQAEALMALDKAAGLRLKADIEWEEDKPAAALAYGRQALAAGAWDWESQYSLVVRAVHYKLQVAESLFDEAERNVHQHAAEDERALRLIDYQRGKYAAVTGRALGVGREGLNRYLSYDPKPGDPDRAWAEFRLAQVERQLGDSDSAQARLARLEASAVPENLGFALQDERRWHYAD